LTVGLSYTSEYFSHKNYLKNRDHKIKKSGWLLDIALHFHPGIKNLLEVGCSVGNTLEAAKLRNIEGFGIDISPFAIKYCREHQLNAENKTLDELWSEGRQFDLIYMQHVLEHFVNPFEVLESCHKLLRKDGLLLVIVPNSRFNPSVRKREKHPFYSLNGVGAEHFVYFDYYNLTRVLVSCRFEVVQKNYPVMIKGMNSPEFLLNRIGRKSLSLFNADQELLLVASKN
jgi:2-polyprenyl-3-methyl-5-hydroxy-6-metoxy-1,4-benzoquinol methylase